MLCYSPQVWDKSENGEWVCTASWKVQWTYHCCSLMLVLNMKTSDLIGALHLLVLFSADTQRICVESDLGSPRVRAGSGFLLLRQDGRRVGRDSRGVE